MVIFGLLDITCGRIKDGMIYPISWRCDRINYLITYHII